MSGIVDNVPIKTFAELNLTELDQQIAIRGFLYQTADKQWILAADPDLKSCCVGASDKARRQIYLEGKLKVPQQTTQAITLQGRFRSSLEGPPYYWLSDVAIVNESPSWGTYTFIGVIFFAIVLAFLLKKKEI